MRLAGARRGEREFLRLVGTEPLKVVALDYYAHTPNESGEWHHLEQHLRDVADLASRFATRFDGADAARLLGLIHDAGKAAPAFQSYLRACHEGRPRVKSPHSAPGAAAGFATLGALALAVLGHHAGLPDSADAGRLIAAADAQAVTAADDLLRQMNALPKAPYTPPAWAGDPLSCEMFVRMCYSALVDADYLDTEAHINKGKAETRGQYRAIDWYKTALDAYMSDLTQRARANPSRVNQVRGEVLKQCRRAALSPRGAFWLTVPTGGGKTLASLTFALDHTLLHSLDRAIVAIPYTSIIDQTAQVFKRVFGEGTVLEHHSAMEVEDTSEGQSPDELRRSLAAENWDCPLVVTTTVQLFESLLGARTSRCRKLHNIAGSVIVLDEVQTLPVHLLLPILDVLEQLIEHYECSIVFCTATQPDFSGLAGTILANAREIVERPKRNFEQLHRVEYVREREPLSAEEVARRIDADRQVLCVVNSRPDAVRVAQACRQEDVYHLSTLMCPAHRRRVLDDVRSRLCSSEPVRLISTQVVEAGVDLDFPVVMRDIGPLDRIAQVAGRCNREGCMENPGRCIVFELQDSKTPKGAYRTGIDLTRAIVSAEPMEIEHPDVVGEYFRQLFTYANAAKGKGEEIQNLRVRLSFRAVAERFRLIDDHTIPLVVLRYDEEAAAGLLEDARWRMSRDLLRKLALYSVSVPKSVKDRLANDGWVREEAGLAVFDGQYSKLFGIGLGNEIAPEDLVV